MSSTAYFGVGALIAGYFFLRGGIEQGEWDKAAAVIVMCALWPVMVGAGVGLMLRSIFRFAATTFANARGEA